MNEQDLLADIALIEAIRDDGVDLTESELDELRNLYEALDAVRGY